MDFGPSSYLSLPGGAPHAPCHLQRRSRRSALRGPARGDGGGSGAGPVHRPGPATGHRTGDGGGRAPLMARDMVAFFESGDRGHALATQALALADEYERRGDGLTLPGGTRAVLPVADVRLLAQVPRPRRIRDYLTYAEHAAGSGLEVPPAFAAMPICYKSNVETVIGPDEPLLWPSYTRQLDFELELGV